MAVVGASYMFTYVDVGDYGRQSDSSVFNNTQCDKSLTNGSLCLPQDDNLPNVPAKARYWFTGDEAFPLKDTLQRLYSPDQTCRTFHQTIFTIDVLRKFISFDHLVR